MEKVSVMVDEFVELFKHLHFMLSSNALQVRLAAQGKLVLQDTFQVSTQGSIEKERRVFFFEQSIIFAEPVDKKNEEKGFTFKKK